MCPQPSQRPPTDRRRQPPTCRHTPTCPAATDPDRDAARVIAQHPEQGWSLLCNGVVLFDDTGELLPNGMVVAPRRPCPRRPHAAARRTPSAA